MNRDEFFHKLTPRSPQEIETLQTAYWLSKIVHREQKRDDGERYFEHPRRVASSLIDHGYNDTDTLVLALLHDVVEDTNTPFKAIIDLFGATTWERLHTISKKIPSFDSVTGEMLKRTDKPIKTYYATIKNGHFYVRLVKLADRLDNLSDMRAYNEMRRLNYIEETRTYLLAMARITCPVYARELELCCNNAAI